MTLWTELAIVLTLIVANGFFSASEIAIVALRKSRLGQLVDEGRRGAHAVAWLKDDSGRFLATVQIGVTVVGSMASVLGGAAASATLEPLLRELPVPLVDRWANPLALALTVGVVSYLTLVVGELAPKSLALRYTERVACASAPLVAALARFSSPAVKVLTGSANVLLRPLGAAGSSTEAFVSEEEVKHIVREGAHKGIFDEAERELIHSVFEFADTSVREVMVPRADIHALEVSCTPEQALKSLLETGFSRAPVYERDLDHIVGVVHIKDLLRGAGEAPPSLASVLNPAFFVPDSMQISDLLRELQSRRGHLATIEDLLEEIVGEIRDEFDVDEELPIQELPDGSLLAEGAVLLSDLKEQYHLPFEETPDYRTLAGFILARLKRIPKGGEALTHHGLRMTIVAVDARRLRKVRIERPPAPAPGAAR
jgi:putative hemolysin